MDKKQQQLLILILIIGFFYTLYISYSKNSNVEGLQNIKYPFSPELSKARQETSYTALTPPEKKDLSPLNMMVGEVYRYSNKDYVSYDIYGYLHLINGSVFEKKVDQKYKVYITDDNAKSIVQEELKRDGDDVYKLKLRDLQISNANNFNKVFITFVDENNDESIVLQGNLVRQ